MFKAPTREDFRRFTQIGFFLLFLLAPLLDIFRLDLTRGHFIIFSYPWTLGLENFQSTEANGLSAAATVLLKIFLPVLTTLSIILFIIWKWGRLYCGWLCPHFSVVETINQLMYKYLNRLTLWEKPDKPANGIFPWLSVIIFSIFMAFVWTFSLLSYLLPPKELISDLINLQLGNGSIRFLLAGTFLLSIDFIFARHLFCRYGCAIGLAQSVIWMGNNKALRVTFDKSLSSQCKSCDNECDFSCPMRLRPRGSKRSKFNCTQCGVCLSTCDKITDKQQKETSVITWQTHKQTKISKKV